MCRPDLAPLRHISFVASGRVVKSPKKEKLSRQILGPKFLLVMGCVKLGEKIAFTCLLWVNKMQINYPISRNA